jgi:hypothetical protein
MDRPLILVAALALASCARQVPDIGDLAGQLCDPASMQLRDTWQSPALVGGYVNARGPDGGYVGYVPFTVDRQNHHAQIAALEWAAWCPPRDDDAELANHIALLELYEKQGRQAP